MPAWVDFSEGLTYRGHLHADQEGEADRTLRNRAGEDA